LGGLPRRATYFEQLRAETPQEAVLFLVAGPHEFLPQSEFDTVPSLVFAPGLIDAYEMLGYQRVYISPQEKDWLEKYGEQPLPDFFRTLDDAPFTEVVEVDGLRVGVVGFPVPPQFFEPSQQDVDAIVQAARSLQGQADIIVGISSWGRQRESFYLQHAEPVLDVLLGSGPGSGMRGVIEGAGSTYWVRSLTKGKYMLVLDINRLPDGAGQRQWKSPGTIRDEFVELGSRIPDDQQVRALFKGI